MPRYTEKLIAKALTDSRGMPHVAARILGCSVNTIKARTAKSTKLQELTEELRQYTLDRAELKLIDCAASRGRFNSCCAKAWEFCQQYKGTGRVLFWNVIAPAGQA